MDVLNVNEYSAGTLCHAIRTLFRQWLPRSQTETFAFFERPENLAAITPAWLGLCLLTPPPIAMRVGLTLDYRVRVLGLPGRWRSLITEYDLPYAFRAVQVRGPGALLDRLTIRRQLRALFDYRRRRLHELRLAGARVR